MVMEDPDKDEKPIKTLSEEDVRIMQTYGAGPYSKKIKKLETDVKEIAKRVNEASGIKESDTGLAHPSRWDLVSDKQMMQEEHPLQVSSASHPFILLKCVTHTLKPPLHHIPSPGCSLYQDCQPWHRRCQVSDQHQANCQVCSRLR